VASVTRIVEPSLPKPSAKAKLAGFKNFENPKTSMAAAGSFNRSFGS